MYHPLKYKVAMCDVVNCRGFYCPFAHGPHELRVGIEAEVTEAAEKEEETGHFLRFDDRLQLHREDWESCVRKPGLLRGELMEKRGVRKCLVRMAPYCRAQRSEAEQVVQDLKEWIRRGNDEAPIGLRRSVATLCVLWAPEVEQHRPLCDISSGVATAVDVLKCLESRLRTLHDAGVAHCCLSPSNIFLHSSSSQRFVLGDFVQKIRLLSLLGAHGKVDDDYETWALWQAPEVLERIQEGLRGREKEKLDLIAIDLWQLGAVAFYALTNSHPYETRENIIAGHFVNMPMAFEKSPQLCRLLQQLMHREPSKRFALGDLQAALKSLQLPTEVPPVLPAKMEEATSEIFLDLHLEARPGAVLRCTWHDGVRFHKPCKDTKKRLRLVPGDEIRVLERDGQWIRTVPGWLPLWGTSAMDHSPLFEVCQRAPATPLPPVQQELNQEVRNCENLAAADDVSPKHNTPPLSPSAPPGLTLPLSGSTEPSNWTQFEWKPDDWKAFWQGFHDAHYVAPGSTSPSSPGAVSHSSSNSQSVLPRPAKVSLSEGAPPRPPGLSEANFIWM